MCWQTRSDIHKFTNTLHPRSLMEVSSTYCLPAMIRRGQGSNGTEEILLGIPNNIKVGTSRYNLHFLELHDIFKLDADLARFSQQLGMQEVTHRPIVAIAGNSIASAACDRPLKSRAPEDSPVALPLVEDVQKRQMITLRNIEFLSSSIRFLHPFLWSIEDARHGQH